MKNVFSFGTTALFFIVLLVFASCGKDGGLKPEQTKILGP